MSTRPIPQYLRQWRLAGYLTALGCLLGLPTAPLCAAGPVTPVSINVDPNADRHPVSPLIYGVNFGSTAQANRLHWPVRRWGGNATTRYSWQDDTANQASDYLFYNIPENNPNPQNLPNGSAADVFIDDTRAAGGEALMTVPLIGWTPVDRNYRWGFSVAKYGPQQQTECTINPFPGCNADAGNGVHTNGTPVTGNDPHDTSRAIDPTFIAGANGWMAHMAARTGTAAAGGVRLFDLDNEPALWNSSHRDVHPNPTTYDELWTRTRDYAAAIKAQDPNAKILGPVSWGWCEYFYSALDGCSAGSDMAAHGNLVWIDWYLKQAADYQAAHGVRLIDYLDVHVYPQGNNVALTADESTATSALRLRSLKSLYDPTYVDESWINQQPVNTILQLIPRMRAWVASRLPGTKIALTEYNWGDGGTSSALAQAEALAIFGREGVDLAARWVAPAENSLIEDAFLFYLNYDGAGAKVAGDSVRALSSDVDGVGAYAVRGTGSRLYLLLFNKDVVVRSTTVQVTGGLSRPATLYRFDGTHRLGAAGSAAPAGGALTLSLPARSATLAVLDLGTPAAAFYTVTPCRLLDTRNPTGPYGGPALAANGERTWNLAGQCGIPAAAQAVAINLTITSPTQGGDLRVFPGGSVPVVSFLNWSAGQIRTNNAVLPLSTDGNAAFSVHLDMGGGTAQLLADVVGYFQ
ncbi:MAG TPA: glycoside hydrolase family 44 protein [Thermoanaerobaculia bacterium]|nr:glycoside hydrolase family 44 protein [Thermoanaerobaculia bacterium]